MFYLRYYFQFYNIITVTELIEYPNPFILDTKSSLSAAHITATWTSSEEVLLSDFSRDLLATNINTIFGIQ